LLCIKFDAQIIKTVIQGKGLQAGNIPTIVGITKINNTITAQSDITSKIIGYVLAFFTFEVIFSSFSSSAAISCKTCGIFQILSADLIRAISSCLIMYLWLSKAFENVDH
jgi:hypothetical protein